MLKGFKEFIMRGNVVDLAIGVVIGAAFSALVTQFTTSFLTPLIAAIGAGGDNIGGTIPLRGKTPEGDANAILYGAVHQRADRVRPDRGSDLLPGRAADEQVRRAPPPQPGAPPPALPSEEIELLREIRDALVAGRTPQPRSPQPSGQDERV